MQLFLNDAFLLVLKYLLGNSCLTMEKINIDVLYNRFKIMLNHYLEAKYIQNMV